MAIEEVPLDFRDHVPARLEQGDQMVDRGTHEADGRSFERLHEAGGVADRNHVPDPRTTVVPAAKTDYPRVRHLRILASKLGLRHVIRDEIAGKHVPAVDELVMFDLPRPAGIHRLRGGERVVGLIAALPPTHHGTITGQGLFEGNEWLVERGPQKLGMKS